MRYLHLANPSLSGHHAPAFGFFRAAHFLLLVRPPGCENAAGRTFSAAALARIQEAANATTFVLSAAGAIFQ
jgi:hypothetical protein